MSAKKITCNINITLFSRYPITLTLLKAVGDKKKSRDNKLSAHTSRKEDMAISSRFVHLVNTGVKSVFIMC